MIRLVVVLAACSLAACSGGSTASEDEGRIRDQAGIIDAATEERMAARLDRAGALYGPQVGIVTVASLEGKTIEKFTTDYANEWGLGDKDRDDGLIIVVAPHERLVRIGTGFGIEQTFPDEWAGEVIERALVPQFRQGDYGQGLESAVDSIIERMREFPTIPANDNAPAHASEAA